MTDSAMRELDAFIAEHVFDGKIQAGNKSCDLGSFDPTVNPFCAMMVLEKCSERDIIKIWKRGDVVTVEGSFFVSVSPSLPLSICLQAKKMFA